ncbi:hypothetical protein [Peribacillus butanolivorans]
MGEDIQAGVSVGTGEDGKIVEALGEDAPPIGYSINAAIEKKLLAMSVM